MSKKVTAVFQCTSKSESAPGQVQVFFSPPYTVDRTPGSAEHTSERYQRVNERWAQATPAGQLQMTITNPSAVEAFEPNEYYLLTFEKFDVEKHAG